MNDETQQPLATGHCRLFHRWSGWHPYYQPTQWQVGPLIGQSSGVHLFQRRHCLRCGKVEREMV